MKQRIKDFKLSGNDGLLNSDAYKYAEAEVIRIIDDIRDTASKSLIKLNVDPARKVRFKADAVEWLASNPATVPSGDFDKGVTNSQRREDFSAWVMRRLEQEKNAVQQSLQTTQGGSTFGEGNNNGTATLVTIDELNNLDGSNTSGTVTFEDTSPKAKQQKKDNKTKSGYFPDSKTLKGTN